MTQQRIIGSSSTLAESLDHASSLASINRPILILGERGTGKELIAERLHYLSPRWDCPLVKVNCAAISESLLDSELFGHESGAFTGASRTHQGRFERAQGGTLFLDEIGNMSGQLQEKLLRVIEYGEFERVGGSKTIQCDVRVVGATHADLKSMAASGEFRADLLDRLTFDVISIPPLRHRLEDIEELADFFALKISHELEWPWFSGFDANAIEQLKDYDWPGNIRELRNVIERSVFRHANHETPVKKIVIDPFKNIEFPTSDDPGVDKLIVESQIEPTVLNFEIMVDNYKKQLVESALNQNQYNQKNTAKSLGLSYDQMRGLIRKYQIG